MKKEITVNISISGLPKNLDCKKLSKTLRERIEDSVAISLVGILSHDDLLKHASGQEAKWKVRVLPF